MTVVEDRPARIDPRIESRRDEIQRERLHRWGRRAAFVVGLLAVLGAGIGLSRSSLLDVDTVTVVGNTHTPTAAVLDAAGIEPGDALVGLDLGGARRRIEQLPWIEKARVDRSWHGPVRIVVDERHSVGLAQLGKEWVVVDRTGRVLAKQKAPGPVTVRILGLRGSSSAGSILHGGPGLLDVASRLDARIRQHGAAVYSADGELRLRMTTGGLVRLGGPDGLDEKLHSLTTVLARVDESCLRVIDVRLPRAPTVTRDPSCAAPGATVGTTTGSPTGESAAPSTPAGDGHASPSSVVPTTVVATPAPGN